MAAIALPRLLPLLLPRQQAERGERLSGKTKAIPTCERSYSRVAWAIAHTKDDYVTAFYHRITWRRGNEIAIMVLCHKVLVIPYHLWRDKKHFSDLGAEYFDQLDRTRVERHHIHRLEQLGYTVTLTPKEAA